MRKNTNFINKRNCIWELKRDNTNHININRSETKANTYAYIETYFTHTLSISNWLWARALKTEKTDSNKTDRNQLFGWQSEWQYSEEEKRKKRRTVETAAKENIERQWLGCSLLFHLKIFLYLRTNNKKKREEIKKEKSKSHWKFGVSIVRGEISRCFVWVEKSFFFLFASLARKFWEILIWMIQMSKRDWAIKGPTHMQTRDRICAY